MSAWLPGIALILHLLAAVVWVGGMFFAYVVLRPVLVARLEGPLRLQVFDDVFSRFFTLVWVAVVLVLASGYAMLGLSGGMAAAPPHIHLMHGLGLLMTVLFVFIFVAPYRRMRALVAASDWPAAAGQLARIRRVIAVNLMLGLITVAVGASRGYFSG